MPASSWRQPERRHTQRELSRNAAIKALRLRRQLGISLNEALCLYDAAERLGIEVRFVDVPSLEGMYVKGLGTGKPLILISAHRPAGRQASTGAHELGHHVFGHGTRIDQYVAGVGVTLPHASVGEPEELLANAFGAFFLMPKSAVERGFRERGLTPSSATEHQVFSIAGWLGVGYTTLVHHMRSSLHLLTSARADALLRRQPKQLKTELLGYQILGNVYSVDHAWTGRPVDLQVGDIALLPVNARVESSRGRMVGVDAGDPVAISMAERSRIGAARVLTAVSPGLARVTDGEWAAFVRVSRQGYVGRNVFRHFEQAGDEGEPTSGVQDEEC
jgi:hypothetical protein